MTDHTTAAQAAMQESERVTAADEYFAARTWIMDTSDNRRIFEAGFDRAYALLSKLRAPVADERAALTRQDIFDRFQFLEGLVTERRYKQIAETAVAIYESGAPWPNMAQTINDLRAELGYLKQYGPRILPDMCPPATSRDRWMYEQGRLSGHAALASAPVAGEAQEPYAWVQEVPGYEPRVFLASRLEDPRKGAWRPEVKWRALVLADAAPQASEAVKQAARHVGHANFTPFYLLANLRRICTPALARRENWVLAIELFAVGGTTARRICREAGIDPDGKTVTRAALSAQPGAQKNGGGDAE